MKIQGVRLQGTKLIPSGAAVVESDTYFNLVSLLLPGNGTNGAQNNTFQDSSSNSLTVTRNGNTTQGTFSPFSQTGWSNYFDGTGDYLNVGTITALGSGDFTISAWVYPQKISVGVFHVGGLPSSVTGVAVFLSGAAAEDGWGLYAKNTQAVSNTGPITLNKWYYITVIRSGTTTTLYVDSVSAVTISSDSTNYTQTSLAIGGFFSTSFLMLGYISNFRIVSSALTATVPTAPFTAVSGTSLLTCQSNRFVDNSANAFAITVNGNTSVQAFSPFDPTTAYSAATVGGSAYLDGSGDYLTISNPASLLTFGTGDFTIECFVYPTVGSSSSYVCWIYGTTVVINAIIINSNTGAVTFRLRGTNLSETDVTSSTGLLRVGEWTHLALVRTGTNFYGYVNGTRFSTTIASNAAFNEAQAQFFTQPQIGAKSNTVGDYFTGYVSGWRALKGTALYTAATITVPTAPLTAIANTSALLNSTNGGIIDATAKNVAETVGGAAISTAQSKFGGSSMYFDGSGDYLVAPPSQNFAMGTGDFTIELWINTTTAADDGILQISTTAGGFATSYTNGLMLAVVSGTLYYAVGGSASSTSTSINNGNWRHIAMARSGSTLQVFVDGTSVASVTNTNSVTGTNLVIGGYYSTSYTLDGYINDLRITKGVARYTSNFTPPTQAFPTQ
jgi:hypothetical protein